MIPARVGGVLLLATALSAQAPKAPATSPITEQRLTELVGFLASDDLGGRDTPSPGLEQAADYLAKAFERAGLQPLDRKQGYFHTYQLPGREVDPAAVRLVLHVAGRTTGVTLQPGADVRIYRHVGREYQRQETTVTVVPEADAALRLRRNAARNPILIAVDPRKSALWSATEGKRRSLVRRRVSTAPILLVRKGALPRGEIDHAELSLTAPRELQLRLRNVVGVLPGGARKQEYVMFSAHYDHIGTGPPVGGDGIFNGADDDATGTAAVVALAEAFAGARPDHARSLLFVCFSGEEKGMLGSKAFADRPPIPLQQIAVNLNLEMLGRPDQIQPKQAWVTGAELSDFRTILEGGFERAGIECVDFAAARMLFFGSDNISLARKGVVAHSISSGSLHRDYHQPTDEVGKLDLANMTAVVLGLYEAGLEFANRQQRPVYNERGRRTLRLDK